MTETKTTRIGSHDYTYVPVEARETQGRFIFMAAEWELQKVFALAATKAPTHTVRPEDYRTYIGGDSFADESKWVQKENGWREFIGNTGWMGIAHDAIRNQPEQYDYRVPVIVAMVTLNDGTTTPLVIDGWHRLARALADGVERVPAIVLSSKEELTCRSWRSVKPEKQVKR